MKMRDEVETRLDIACDVLLTAVVIGEQGTPMMDAIQAAVDLLYPHTAFAQQEVG